MCCSGRSQTDARGAYAAEGGQLDVLQWARANGCPWDAETCWGAAHKGHLEVLKWARANGCPWNASTREKAAELGYINTDGSLCDESREGDIVIDESDDDDDWTSEDGVSDESDDNDDEPSE
jgi:hypothetical protein